MTNSIVERTLPCFMLGFAVTDGKIGWKLVARVDDSHTFPVTICWTRGGLALELNIEDFVVAFPFMTFILETTAQIANRLFHGHLYF